jgi:hypothetical protein
LNAGEVNEEGIAMAANAAPETDKSGRAHDHYRGTRYRRPAP